MGLKPGYKPTEVGVLPEDWNLIPFDELGKVIDGDRGVNYPSGKDFRADGYCLFLNAGNVTQDGFRFIECSFISRAKDEVLSKGKLRREDIVLTTRGTVGNFAYFDSEIPFNHMRINSGMVILRNESQSILNTFLYNYLQSHMIQLQVERLSFGSAQPQLTVKGISKLLVVVPPTTDEQKKVANALSDVDALLEGLDRLIAKKRDLKQAAMQELLTGDTRLPGFAGEWETKRLGDLASIVMGQSPSSSNYNSRGDGLPLIQGNADIEDRRTIKRIFTTQITKRAQAGDVLMSVRAPVGEISQAAYDVCLGRGVCALRFPNDFLYQYLIFLETAWAKHSKGSTFESINSTDLKAVEIQIPSDAEEQEAIASVLSDMDAEIEALEQRRAKTANLKQAMMQELLTGKTRLVELQASDEQTDAASGNAKGHNWAINEAVVIATLVKHFGGENYPLGRKRYTKLSYLLHRHVERQAEGYLKKAAGPYNPQTKYGGPEKIAKQNGYITQHKGPKGHSGFIAADNIAQAEGYFEKWYGPEVIQWLEQFRYKKNDDMEVLATVDMAALELRASGKTVNVAAVKYVITSHPEWEAKLDRAAFSDANIAEAIKQSDALLGSEIAGGSHA
ncbi:MAG: restriction endonuclease subunit S [Alkalispirochaeta sp.]